MTASGQPPQSSDPGLTKRLLKGFWHLILFIPLRKEIKTSMQEEIKTKVDNILSDEEIKGEFKKKINEAQVSYQTRLNEVQNKFTQFTEKYKTLVTTCEKLGGRLLISISGFGVIFTLFAPEFANMFAVEPMQNTISHMQHEFSVMQEEIDTLTNRLNALPPSQPPEPSEQTCPHRRRD